VVTSGSLGRPRIVVIGVGNPFRGDDGAGPEVARRVRAATPSWVDVVEHDGEPAGLLDVWEGADLAVVVDAVRSHPSSPGHVHRVLVEASMGVGAPSGVSSHAGGPGDAVALARALDRLPARLVLYGIEGATFSAGLGLTPSVESSVTAVVARIVSDVTI
jgi:hydrogenase maturation protease